MALPLPNLDNRFFDDLVKELKLYIPRYAPNWTDHNHSDPGITILEVIIWIAEMVLYRNNRVSEESYEKFLSLITGGQAQDTSVPIDERLRDALLNLKQQYRVITEKDFEEVAYSIDDSIARVVCMANKNLEYVIENEMNHISLVVIPKVSDLLTKPEPSAELTTKIWDELFNRRLLSTRLHVVGPKYCDIQIDFDVEPEKNYGLGLYDRIKDELAAFLNPTSGGFNNTGWPFGRDVFISEIYKIIEETEGVAYTKYARLKPEMQIIDISFNSSEVQESLELGSLITTQNSSFRLAEPINRGATFVNVIGTGFKAGDVVSITDSAPPYTKKWTTVVSVSTSNWKNIILKGISESVNFTADSVIETEDKTVASKAITDFTLSTSDVEVATAGIIIGDDVTFKNANGEIIQAKNIITTEYQDNIPCTNVGQYFERVYLDEGVFPWYVRG